ncbi:hypothetical protein DFR42_12228 [Undibacterium pigrum]|uniref:Uncharacterized protein n=1 Tax=Undibacterium pigrum TaxID=401470 RepID=A0A318IQ10_9BURK|nr:hypothetical protein DFR42_12228 [Undibacterium pigrum]
MELLYFQSFLARKIVSANTRDYSHLHSAVSHMPDQH